MLTASHSCRSATQILQQSCFPSLRRLAVEESSSEVCLTGSVSSYYLKQLAQEAVMPALDQRALRNSITVIPPKG